MVSRDLNERWARVQQEAATLSRVVAAELASAYGWATLSPAKAREYVDAAFATLYNGGVILDQHARRLEPYEMSAHSEEKP